MRACVRSPGIQCQREESNAAQREKPEGGKRGWKSIPQVQTTLVYHVLTRTAPEGRALTLKHVDSPANPNSIFTLHLFKYGQ